MSAHWGTAEGLWFRVRSVLRMPQNGIVEPKLPLKTRLALQWSLSRRCSIATSQRFSWLGLIKICSNFCFSTSRKFWTFFSNQWKHSKRNLNWKKTETLCTDGICLELIYCTSVQVIFTVRLFENLLLQNVKIFQSLSALNRAHL